MSELGSLKMSARPRVLIPGPWRIPLLVWSGAFLFALLVMLVQLETLGFERSPFVRMTIPITLVGGLEVNPFYGYSMAVDDGSMFRQKIVHKENFSVLVLSRKLVGGDAPLNFYDLRVMQPFLASSLGWLFGTIPAALFTNVLLWSVSILVGFLFGRDLSRSVVGGLVSAGLMAVGVGYWYHVLDLSAHLAGFTTYAAGGYAIYRSGIWRERAGWRVHALLALIMAIACATYNSGIMFVGVYVGAAFLGRNRLQFVVPAVLFPLAFQFGWMPLMGAFGIDTAPIANFESVYLARSIRQLLAGFQGDFGHTLATAGLTLFDLSFHEPVIMLTLILLSASYLAARYLKTVPDAIEWRLIALFGLLIFMPVAMSFPWSGTTLVRGYVAYPSHVAVYASIAGLLVAFSRMGRPWRVGSATLASAAILLHVAILQSAMRGNPAPVQSHFLGGIFTPDMAAHLVSPPQTTFVSLTGGGLPTSLGGSIDVGSSVPEGRFHAPDAPPSYTRLRRTVTWRGYLALPFLLLATGWAFQTPGLRTGAAPVAVVLGLIFLPIAMSPLTQGKETIRSAYFETTVDASEAHRVQYEVVLSDAAASSLRSLAAHGAAVEFAFSNAPGSSSSVSLGERTLVSAAWRRFDASEFANVRAGDVLTLRYDNRAAPIGWLQGYRRSTTPGARLFIDDVHVGGDFLPYFELRAYDTRVGGWPVLLAL